MRRSASLWRTALMSRLRSGAPGMTAGPRSPPLSSAARESTRRPPLTFSPPWHLKHCCARTGRTFSSKKVSASGGRVWADAGADRRAVANKHARERVMGKPYAGWREPADDDTTPAASPPALVSGSAALLFPRLGLPARSSLLTRGAAREASEDLFDGEGQARQDFAAVEGIRFGQRDGPIGGGEYLNRTPLWVHEPDQLDAGDKIILELPLHFSGRIPLAEDFNGQVGDEIRYGLLGQFVIG